MSRQGSRTRAGQGSRTKAGQGSRTRARHHCYLCKKFGFSGWELHMDCMEHGIGLCNSLTGSCCVGCLTLQYNSPGFDRQLSGLKASCALRSVQPW